MRALLIHEFRDLGRADKTDGLNVGMGTDPLDDLFSAVDDVENTVRQTGFFQYLGHTDNRQRHELTWLHYHRVAEHECVWHRPIRHHKRKIERHDRGDDTYRKMLGPAL